MNQKYIITGGPGTGKTSIINELKNRGFNCIDEVSREIITDQMSHGGDILPWKNQIAFENRIANIRAQQYSESPKNCICFFDRSVFDCIAYLKVNNLNTTSEILKNIKKYNFNNTVFYTPIWEEIYKNDRERIENIEMAMKIQKSIIQTYKYYGYKLIEIPKFPITERTDFIISKT